MDDDRAAADLLTRSLRLGGYDARAAYGAQRALALFRQWHADAAVLSVTQEMEGIELARKLRQMSTRALLLVSLMGKKPRTRSRRVSRPSSSIAASSRSTRRNCSRC